MNQIYPSLEQFTQLARTHRVVPIWTTLLADLTTPVAAFIRLCGDDDTGQPGFLLESVDHGGQWGRWSFVGRNPRLRLVARDGNVIVEGAVVDGLDLDLNRGALGAIESLTNHFQAPTAEELGEGADGLPPLHSGVVGFLGYDIVREVEHLPNAPEDTTGWPDAIMNVINELAVYDHWTQQATLIVSAFIPDGSTEDEIAELYRNGIAQLEQMSADGATPIDEPLVETPRVGEAPEVRSSLGGGMYERAVEVGKEYIRSGDVFQVVIAQRFETDTTADPLDMYRVLRRVNPSPYMYFIREPELNLVGCSPEPMVQVLDGRVISRPIAGTRYRGRTDEHDRQLAAELAEHPKERAEHIMLVDLARNDLGRVVEFGTCQVDELMVLERYSHVMHLTSQVSGVLASSKSAVDVLRATLPAGTVSGAPKVRAMEVIDELEPVRRGPYAGVVGYIDFSGQVDTAIAIRTMVMDPPGPDGTRRATVQAGAGVVADSVPTDEELETRNKAKALLVAIPAAEAMTAARWSAQQGSGRGATASNAGSTPAAAVPTAAELATLVTGVHANLAQVVTLSGPDAKQLLHSQLSQDIESLGDGESTVALLLEPQGKLDTLIRVVRIDADTWILDADVDLAGAEIQGRVVGALQERIGRFKLRAEVDITTRRVMKLRVRRSSAAGTSAQQALRTVVARFNELNEQGESVERDQLLTAVVNAPWGTPESGAESGDGLTADVYLSVTNVDEAQEQLSELSSSLNTTLDGALSPEDMFSAQVLSGWPINGIDSASNGEADTIPAELGTHVIDAAVSFTKGCYTGQELVARVDSRGNNTPRKLRTIVFPTLDAGIAPGDAISDPEDTATAIGQCTVVTTIGDRTIAKAYIQRSALDRDTVVSPTGVVGTIVSEG